MVGFNTKINMHYTGVNKALHYLCFNLKHLKIELFIVFVFIFMQETFDIFFC